MTTPAPLAPAAADDATRKLAQPQRVPAAEEAGAGGGPARDKRKPILIGGAIVVVVAVIVAVIALVSGGGDDSPEGQVKQAVNSYADALKTGDLSSLQATTCGKLHDFYQNIAPDQYAGVHKLAVDQKKVLKVDKVDAVEITGDKAVAQAYTYTDSDPGRASARTFDLQQTDGSWKVCDPAGAAQ